MVALSRAIRLIEMSFILRSYNPGSRNYRFGLIPFRSPLLRESLLISFPWLLRCFSSPGVLDVPIFLTHRNETLLSLGFPIRKPSGQRLLASRRSLSQLIASFIGTRSRGIHFTLLSNLLYYLKKNFQKTNYFNQQLVKKIAIN